TKIVQIERVSRSSYEISRLSDCNISPLPNLQLSVILGNLQSSGFFRELWTQPDINFPVYSACAQDRQAATLTFEPCDEEIKSG
ncbi:hypothetical protein HispidOSU_014049, partial [Sigmodon hispidus]